MGSNSACLPKAFIKKGQIKWAPSFMHRLDRAVPTLYKYMSKNLWINQVDFNASRELSIKIYPPRLKHR